MTRRILPFTVAALALASSYDAALRPQDAKAQDASGQAADPTTARPRQRAGTVPDLSSIERDGLFFTDLRRIVKGFQISPVDLDLQGTNVALVGLGSYIVNAQGGCNDCHTNPSFEEGGDPFLGQPKRINADRYLAGGHEFGPIVSRNLTPDDDGRPAGLTFAQFREVMRTGKDFKNLPPHVPSAEQDLLQVMPWPVYGEMLESDLRAVYEFLRAIPPQDGFPE